jgi:hypothetical protein
MGAAEFLRRSGTSQRELDRMPQIHGLGGHAPLAFAILSAILSVGYLVWIRPDVRRFRRRGVGVETVGGGA